MLAHFANPIEQATHNGQGEQQVGDVAREGNQLQGPVEKISQSFKNSAQRHGEIL